jgi:hypothetical protein
VTVYSCCERVFIAYSVGIDVSHIGLEVDGPLIWQLCNVLSQRPCVSDIRFTYECCSRFHAFVQSGQVVRASAGVTAVPHMLLPKTFLSKAACSNLPHPMYFKFHLA